VAGVAEPLRSVAARFVRGEYSLDVGPGAETPGLAAGVGQA